MYGKRLSSCRDVAAVRYRMLLAGASAIALANGSFAPQTARASSLNTLVSPVNVARSNNASTGLAVAPSLGQQTAAAAAATKQSLQDMVKAANAITAQGTAQAAARLAATITNPLVTDGLAGNGLIAAPPSLDTLTTAASGIVDTPTLLTPKTIDPNAGNIWYGAKAPTESVSGTQHTVTIVQSAAKAVLSWTNFNVGPNTTLVFDQSKTAASSPRDAVVLNRVLNPAANPSYIEGKIEAQGQVYVINHNGVIFTGTSQVDVNTLVVSSLDVGSPTVYNKLSGVYSPAALTDRNTYFFNTDPSQFGLLQLSAPDALNSMKQLVTDRTEGPVTVEEGAQILGDRTLSPADPYLGRVMLIAPDVSNAGTISVPDGQVVLVSALNVLAYSNSLAALGIVDPTLKVDPDLRGVRIGINRYEGPDNFTGTVTNTGFIQVKRGNITIEANTIDQYGVLEATTSVKANGSIFLTALDAGGSSSDTFFDPGNIVFGADPVASQTISDSVAAILPDTDPAIDGSIIKIPSNSVTSSGYRPSVIRIALPQAFVGEYAANMRDTSFPTGAATFENGSLIEAPAANVTFSTTFNNGIFTPPTSLKPNLVLMSGSAIDVAGLTAVQHSVADNIVNIARVGLNELANSPLQRGGPIYRANVNVDRRLGTPLFDASGYTATYGLTSQDLAVNGGTVRVGVVYDNVGDFVGSPVAGVLSGPTITVAAVTAFEPGAAINVSGGYTTYTAGYLNTTKLITADGSRLVDISQASPNLLYAGIAGSFSVDHSRWGVTTTFNDLLFVNPRGTYDPGYIQGGNAGSVLIAGSAEIGGTIDAGVVQGDYQRSGAGVYASAPPTRGAINLANLNLVTVEIEPTTPTAASLLNPDGTLPVAAVTNLPVGADFFTNSDAGAITLTAADTITLEPNAAITLAPATTLSLSAPNLVIGSSASIVDPGGTINLTLNGSAPNAPVLPNGFFTQTLTVADHALLSVAGNWVNDTGANVATLVGSDYVNGGSISISSTGIFIDTISLGSGARLDLDGGGYVNSAGHLAYGANGLPLGKAGNLTIALHQLTDGPFAGMVNVALPLTAAGVEQIGDTVTVDPSASFSAYGLAGGGSFTLEGPQITVTQAGSATLPSTIGATGQFDVSTAFLENAGFGSYSLTAELTALVPGGTVVQLQQLQYLPTANAQSATSLAEAVILGRNTGVLRPATNFSLSALGWIDGVTAATNFYSFTAGLYGYTPNLSKSGIDYGSPNGFGAQIANNALVVGQGAAIVADPGATVSLSATGSLDFEGTITAPGGTIRLSQINDYSSSAGPGGSGNVVVDYFGELTLGKSSLLDSSGVLVPDPRQLLYRGGNVLPGGAVTVSATELFGVTGSAIDAAGASGILDLPGAAGLQAPSRQAETVTSGGGQIAFTGAEDPTAGMVGLIYGTIDTFLNGSSGGGDSAGGTLDVTSDVISLLKNQVLKNPPSFAKQVDEAVAAAKVRVGSGNAASGAALSTDRIDAGGFDVVNLAVFKESLASGSGTLTIGNNADLNPNRLLSIEGFETVKLASSKASATLAAPYIRWLGVSNPDFAAKPVDGAGTLTVSAARVLKIGGSMEFNEISNLDLHGSQIVFVPDTSPTANSGQIPYTGELLLPSKVPGTHIVTLDAGTIYPATGVSFTIDSGGSVDFINSAASAPIAPLSVAGTLSVDAVNISVAQGATIAAPYGQINLGTLNSATLGSAKFAPTASVTLSSGSLVTVSGADQFLPYGETQNLQTWLYGEVGVLNSAPAKTVNINAAHADIASGAKIDLSGGGDIFAYEFVTGLGGATNVLSAVPTNGFTETTISNKAVSFAGAAVAGAPVLITITLPDGKAVDYVTTNGDTPATIARQIASLITSEGIQASASGGNLSTTAGISAHIVGYTGTAYAIVPKLQGQGAPVDLSGYADANNLADPAVNAIGRTITLGAPADGLAAGTYYLLPVAYANLPGAVRVQIAPNTANLANNFVATGADGTVTVAGTLGYAGSAGVANGSRSSQNVAVSLQTAPVWKRYSQINITTGNAYFAKLATGNGSYIPPLPADSGTLSIDVASNTSGLILAGTLDFATGTGGRGGELDIAATAIDIISAGQTGETNALVLTPADIAGFGAPRLLLGATEHTTTTGETLNVVASTITVTTAAGDKLVNPEITLAAIDSITVASGVVIDAQGTLAASQSGTIAIGAAGVPGSGDGAILRVSNAGPASISRIGIANATGTVSFGDQVVLGGDSAIGGAAAIEIGGTSAVTIPVSSTITAGAIDITGQTTTFTTGAVTPGGVQFNGLGSLGEATSLAIRGSSQVVFDTALDLSPPANSAELQNFTLDTPSLVLDADGGGGTVTITSSMLTLTNDFAPNNAATPPSGVSVASVGNLTLKAGNTLSLTGNSSTIYGFNQVTATAGTALVIGGAGDQGALSFQGGAFTATTPTVIAGAGSNETIKAGGAIVLLAPSSGPVAPSAADVGGHIAFKAPSITVETFVSAVAGEIDLTAQGGAGIEVTKTGSLNAQGFTKQYLSGPNGTVTVLPGGAVKLEADVGNIVFDPKSVINIAADTGGNAGSISFVLGSTTGTLSLATQLQGQSGGGATSGGSFSIDSLGAIDLTALAPLLTASGFTNRVSVESGVGNLMLMSALTARQVLLSADDAAGTGGGRVIVSANIIASGNSANGEGGTAQLYGTSGVTLTSGAVIMANATDPTQRGGQVTIGVGIDANGKSGVLDLQAGSTIDVSAVLTPVVNPLTHVTTLVPTRSYGSDASRILFRTPFVNADGVTAWTGGAGANAIATATVLRSTLTGYSLLPTYTTAGKATTTPNVILDPYQRIDVPAYYTADASGVSTIASWTKILGTAATLAVLDATGKIVVTPAVPAQPGLFQPDTVKSLTGMVFASGATTTAPYSVEPGLELSDPTGTIKITADLDLAAVSPRITTSGGAQIYNATPLYRYGQTVSATYATSTNVGKTAGATPGTSFSYTTIPVGAEMPGILTIRAAGDIDLQATISDGFTYIPNAATPNGSDINSAASLEQQSGLTVSQVSTVYVGKKMIPEIQTVETTYSANPLLLSWSYQFVAGARFGSENESGNPIALAQATSFNAGATQFDRGNVVVGAPPTLNYTAKTKTSTSFGLSSVLLRTGTGSIGIYAGGEGIGAQGVTAVLNTLSPQEQAFDAAAGFHVDADAAVLLLNPGAAIYTAGYNATVPSTLVTAADNLYVGEIGQANKLYNLPGPFGNLSSDAAFINPSFLGADWNNPAFATLGGDLTIVAPLGAIVAQQHFHDIYLTATGALDLSYKSVNSDHTLLTSDTFGQLYTGVGSDLGENSNYWLNGGSGQNFGPPPAVWVETGMFREGVAAMGGGDVAVTAGGDIRDIAASIVSTYYVTQSAATKTAPAAPATLNNNGYGFGGGNLTIAAGNNISSIVTQVEQGNTVVTAGGGVLSNAQIPVINAPNGPFVSAGSSPVGSSFTWSEGSVDVFSRGAMDGVAVQWENGIFDVPSISSNFSQSFAPSFYTASLANHLGVLAEQGDLTFTSTIAGSQASNLTGTDTITPPAVTLASVSGSVNISGGLQIAPSATGNVDIVAQGSIYHSGLQFADLNPTLVYSPTNLTGVTLGFAGSSANGYALDDINGYADGQTNYTLHDPTILRANDPQPFRMIALAGDIATGVQPTGETGAIDPGVMIGLGDIYVAKPAVIWAGRDIINLSFAGENNHASDTTLVEAGRDITFTTASFLDSQNMTIAAPQGSNFIIGGPGAFDLIAGRNLNLEPTSTFAGSPLLASNGTQVGSGLQAVGDGINPWLPATESAQINILFGVSPGIDNIAFIAKYLDPAPPGASAATNNNPQLQTTAPGANAQINNSPNLGPASQPAPGANAANYDPLLQAYIQAYTGASTTPTVGNALAAFGSLTPEAQLPFLEQVLFDEIKIVADPNAPNHQYQNFTRAYVAINALFPAAYGYSNDTVKNSAGKHNLVSTGDFNMTNAVVSTRYTSDISVLGPGGGATVGGLSPLGAAGKVIPVNEQGILAIRGGSISALVDTSFNVFSSRVLALDGGGVTIASINGNIDAGRGKKTVSVVPPLTVAYTPFLSAFTDPSGQITGSGIGTLVTVPGESSASVYLLAPNGDIDAGDAGVRASGNLFILALAVLNGENLMSGGRTTGVPTVATVAISALNAANASTASTANANNFANQNAPSAQQTPSIITVEVLGFGEASP